MAKSKSKTFPSGLTEKHLALAYKMLKCRDTCRTFYGDAWQTKQEEWKPIIRAVMREQNTDEVLQAAIVLGKKLEGFSLMTCLGTVMEMMDN